MVHAKSNTQNNTKHAEHQDAKEHLEKKLFCDFCKKKTPTGMSVWSL